jgi:hypothetical protein
VPVGESGVWCIQGPFQVEPDTKAPFTIVDPEHWFVPYQLDCPEDERRELWLLDAYPGAQGDSIDEAVRISIAGVLPSDTVERAGYLQPLDDPWPDARVVRNGAIIARFFIDGRDYWKYQVLGGAYCVGSGIGAR